MADLNEQSQTNGSTNSGASAGVTGGSPKFDFNHIKSRAIPVLTKPNVAWDEIYASTESIIDVYLRYSIFLAAIGPVAVFISGTLFGETPFFTGLVSAIVTFVLGLVGLYIVALIFNALAPKFEGTENLNQAFKLIAYSATAGQLGGIFQLIPAMAPLQIVTGIWSLYILYVGVPRMLMVPQSRQAVFTLAAVAVTFVAMFILMAAVTLTLVPQHP